MSGWWRRHERITEDEGVPAARVMRFSGGCPALGSSCDLRAGLWG
jgi:hypothetical protein